MIKYICDICGKEVVNKSFLEVLRVPMKHQNEAWEEDKYDICKECQKEFEDRLYKYRRNIIDDMMKEAKND